ncbi:MAG: hypothetical protein WKI04_00335 [Ferruginibacter sp.]
MHASLTCRLRVINNAVNEEQRGGCFTTPAGIPGQRISLLFIENIHFPLGENTKSGMVFLLVKTVAASRFFLSVKTASVA